MLFQLVALGEESSPHLWIQLRRIDSKLHVSLNNYVQGLPDVISSLKKIANAEGSGERVRIEADQEVSMKEFLQTYQQIRRLGFERIECSVESIQADNSRTLRTVTFGEEEPVQESGVNITAPVK